jgi:hypothetical protein
MLCHATGHMSMVVLRRKQAASFPAGALVRKLSRSVIGVQIVDQELRSHGEELLVKADIADEGSVSLIVVQVAHVMAEEGLATAAESECHFELSPTARIGRWHSIGNAIGRGA